MLSEPEEVLFEIHRILKPTGVLSVSVRYWKEELIIKTISANELFELTSKKGLFYNFKKKANG